MAERGVKTVKFLLVLATASYVALMTYKASPPTWCKLCPAKLLMGCKLCAELSQTRKYLLPD